MRRVLLWFEIYKELKEEINKGRYKSGDKFLKIKDICKKFNVSEITARRVLNELEREKLIIKKQRIGTIINRTNLKLFFIVPHVWNLKNISSLPIIQAEVLKGIFKKSVEENVEIEFVDEKTFFKNIKNGIYFLFYHSLDDKKEKEILEKISSNIVIVHSPVSIKNIHTIRVNLYNGAYIAVIHLIERGYKRIGFITGSLKNEWFLLRFEGYLSALRERKIGFDVKFVKETDGEKEENDWNAFEELLNLKNPPDAIFCANDKRAIHILEYCYKKNIKVPDEIGIIGFDNIPETEITNPPLTTIETHLEKLGEKAIELGIKLTTEKIKETQDIVIEPEIIIRKST
ncbi:MAG: GntR family transcriptional regulator [Candidatus Omnitrophica bacterium]|nr:GntR family transcriptional regulator [Candidatus Omnitrophota bacterium]